MSAETTRILRVMEQLPASWLYNMASNVLSKDQLIEPSLRLVVERDPLGSRRQLSKVEGAT